jgi:hypothetical protein
MVFVYLQCQARCLYSKQIMQGRGGIYKECIDASKVPMGDSVMLMM